MYDQELNEIKQEFDGLKLELERLTPDRRLFLTILVAALVLIGRVFGLNKALMAVAGLLALVLVLPKINDQLDRFIPWLDQKLNG